MSCHHYYTYYFILLLIVSSLACKTIDKGAPDPSRFATRIAAIQSTSFDSAKERIVFTGSSSILFWKSLPEYYPNHQVINAGFGGSQMSDLSHYLNETVLQFSPSKVFIYEGDNDIAAERPLTMIMKHTSDVVKTIEKQLPSCQVILIAAKPSIARWNLKEEYLAVNQALKEFAGRKSNRHYADVWSIMLDDNGEVFKDIFIEDGLHMNKKGYDLWDQIIRPFVEM